MKVKYPKLNECLANSMEFNKTYLNFDCYIQTLINQLYLLINHEDQIDLLDFNKIRSEVKKYKNMKLDNWKGDCIRLLEKEIYNFSIKLKTKYLV